MGQSAIKNTKKPIKNVTQIKYLPTYIPTKFLLHTLATNPSRLLICCVPDVKKRSLPIVGASAVVITIIIILVFRPMPSTCCNVVRQNCSYTFILKGTELKIESLKASIVENMREAVSIKPALCVVPLQAIPMKQN